MSADRDRLLAAIVAAPRDMTARLALADWHEEAGRPHVAALLRVVPALVAVPEPREPDAACRAWAEREARPDGSGCRTPLPELRLPVPIRHPDAGAGGYRGVHGCGRLAGVAALWLAWPAVWAGHAALPSALRILAAAELYSAGAIGHDERDRLSGRSADPNGPVRWHAILWPCWWTRRGPAGRAVLVMDRCELNRAAVTPAGTLAAWRHARALARTHHLALLARFAALAPWAAADALLLAHRRRVQVAWRARQEVTP